MWLERCYFFGRGDSQCFWKTCSTFVWRERGGKMAAAASGEVKRTRKLFRTGSIAALLQAGLGATPPPRALTDVWEGIHWCGSMCCSCSAIYRAYGVVAPWQLHVICLPFICLFGRVPYHPDEWISSKIASSGEKRRICIEAYRWEWWSCQ